MRTLHLLLNQSTLTESLKVTALNDPNLGLWTLDLGPHVVYVLIDIAEFNKTCEEWRKAEGAGTVSDGWRLQIFLRAEGYKHYVRAAFNINKKERQPCYDAASIRASSAEPGLGPAIYELIMAYHGGLIPDRGSVSTQARRVWAKFKDRADIISMKLDDFEYPLTPDPQDDCKTHDWGNDDSLDYAYRLSPEDESMAKAIGDRAHRRGLNALRDQRLDPADQRSKDMIEDNYFDFFRNKYVNREVGS